jgi:TolB protein
MRRGSVVLVTLTLAACTEATPLPPLLVLGSDFSVRAVDEAGVALDLLTGDPNVVANQPTWAPDGRLAVWTEIDRATGVASIAMGNAESQRRMTGDTAPYFYAWSPNGERVSYLGNAPDGSGVAMGMIDVAAGTARLVDSGSPYFLDWAPDSSRLAVHTANSDLAYVDLEGNRAPIDVESGLFQAPAFLPDGRLLIARAAPEPGITVLDGTASPLVVAVEGVTFFAPSGDGNLVAFSDNSKGDALGSLSVVALGGGETLQVSGGPVVAFQWSPHDNRLLFITVDFEALKLVPGVWDNGEVTTFEPLVPTSVFIRDYLPFWDQYSRVLTLWSSDGTEFALPADDAEGGGIQIYDVATGTNRRLIDGTFASWRP